MSYTSQKLRFNSYTNGVSPHIGRAANNEEEGYWYIGATNTWVRAQGPGARVMLLNNDYDVIAINPLGEVVGALPTVTVTICEGDSLVLGQEIIVRPPSGWKPTEHFWVYADTNEEGERISYILEILKIPTGFTSGTFVFSEKNGILTKNFNITTITSEKDYDIIAEKMIINTTNVEESGDSVAITVKETGVDGVIIHKQNSDTIILYKDGAPFPEQNNWIINYTNKQTTPVELVLKVRTATGEWIEWDKETIEFIADGLPGTHGDDSEIVYAYYVTSEQTINIPDKPDGQPSLDPIENDWWLTNHDLPVDEKYPYLYMCEGTKKTTYTDSNATTTYTWSTPKLHKAWHESEIDPESYAAFLTATNFGEQDALYWTEAIKDNQGQITEKGKLYINASYIKTGLFEVTKDGGVANADGSNVLLYAGWNKDTGEGKVQLAGWDVNDDSISKEDVYISSGDKYLYKSSLTNKNTPARFAAGTTVDKTETYTGTSGDFVGNNNAYWFTISFDPGIQINSLKELTDNCQIINFEAQDDNEIFKVNPSFTTMGTSGYAIQGATTNPKMSVIVTVKIRGTAKQPTFYVLQDGSLRTPYASAEYVFARSLKVGTKWRFEEKDIWSERTVGENTYRTMLRCSPDSTIFAVRKTNNSTGAITWPFSVSRTGGLYAAYATITDLTISGRCDVEHKYNGVPYRLSLLTNTESDAAILTVAYDDTDGKPHYNFVLWRSGHLKTQGDIRTEGKISAKGTITQNDSSDARIKNSIETLPLQYDIFFDNMRPCRYKYNAGESNRYHTGYIAQELVQALEGAGLTTQDFAGVMLEEPGTENECWYLRRDEFVALNTWQIQKLKPRMTAAETEIAQLKQEISSLKQEIENLKNS